MTQLEVKHRPFICTHTLGHPNGSTMEFFRIRINDEYLEKKLERMGIIATQTLHLSSAEYPINFFAQLDKKQVFELSLLLGSPYATHPDEGAH